MNKKQTSKFLFNIIFILFLILLFLMSYYFINLQNKELEELAKLKYDEIEVFLKNFKISALHVEDKSIYVGGSDGILLLDSNTMKVKKVISKELELIYSSSMYMDNNRLWIAHDNGIAYYKNNVLTTFSYPDIPKGRCNSITSYNDTIIAGFETGVAIFNNKNITILNSNDGLAEDYVNVISSDEYIIYGLVLILESKKWIKYFN